MNDDDNNAIQEEKERREKRKRQGTRKHDIDTRLVHARVALPGKEIWLPWQKMPEKLRSIKLSVRNLNGNKGPLLN
jgi:hypothetical protein